MVDHKFKLIIQQLNSLQNEIFFLNQSPFDLNKVEDFLNKYWIYERDFTEQYLPLQKRVFNYDGRLDDYLFNKNFDLIGIPHTGGTFTKDEYSCFQKLLKEIGEKFFFIVEDHTDKDYMLCPSSTETFGQEEYDQIHLKFKFPVDITYEELNSGDIISKIMLDGMYPGDFFIFGETSLWCKYAENTSYDLYILGFDNKIISKVKQTYGRYFGESKKLYELILSDLNKAKQYYGHLKKYLPKLLIS